MNMNKLIVGICGMCIVANAAHARVEKVTAIGYGASEYLATADAIDNAIRQTSTVSGGGDSVKVKTEEFNMVDTRKVKASGKKWWKFWQKDKDSKTTEDSGAEMSVDYRGGEVHADYIQTEREIQMKYSGQIEGYSVISMDKDKNGKKYTAKIEARVFVVDDYVSPDMVQKSKYRVVVTDFAGQKTWDCLSPKPITGVLEREIAQSKKMTLVDRANFDKQLKELGLVTSDIANRENQSKLKQVQVADYMLVASIDNFTINRTEKDIAKTKEHISKTDGTLSISYKLIETATMDVVSSDSVEKSVHYDSKASCNTVAEALAKKTAGALATAMLTDVFPDYKPAVKTEAKKSAPKAEQVRPIVKLPGDN